MQSSTPDDDLTSPLHWRRPLFNIIKTIIAFSVITFFLVYFIYHRPVSWIAPACILAISYVFCLIMGVRYLIKNIPLPILMLLVPIAPLYILLYVLALIAFLQRFT